MIEEEKKVIEIVENFIKYYKKNEQTGNRANLDVLREECNAIEFILNKYDIQQKELEKKDKVINEMAKDLMQFVKEPVLLPNEIIKEYIKKVEHNEDIN